MPRQAQTVPGRDEFARDTEPFQLIRSCADQLITVVKGALGGGGDTGTRLHATG